MLKHIQLPVPIIVVQQCTFELAHLKFVYDFFEMWTFVAELISIEDKPAVLNYPLTVYRFGAMPLKAPKRDVEILDLEGDEDIDFAEDAGLNDLQIDDDLDLDDL